MARLSVPARIYRWSVIFVGTAVLAGLMAGGVQAAIDPYQAVIAAGQAVLLVGALVFAGLHPVQLAPNEKMNVGTALMFGAALSISPLAATVLSTLGTGIHNALLRRPWDNVLFNMAQSTLSVAGAAVLFRTLDPDGDFRVIDPVDIPAAILAATLYFVLSTTIAGVMIAFLRREPHAKVLPSLWRHAGAQYAALLALGTAGAAIWQVQPLALVLVVPPVVMVHRSNQQLAIIREANQKLEEALQAQRRFVADASHELRTPLATIQGNLDLLLAGPPRGAGVQEALTDTAREVNRLSRLVADLLTLAQADEGQPLARVPTDLEALSYDVYRQQLRPLAGQVSTHFTIEEARDEGVIAWVDPDRYRQLLGNLLDNALKYTPPGGQIHVRVSAEGDWARVDVSDTGIGIPPEHQARIFERLYRVDEARARSSGGAGLGLAIAKWIAEAHGGRITVVSEPGHGSTFTIWLPLRKA